MKPFNLERAIAGDKIVTRGWQHVKFVAYLPELGDDHQVVCVVDGSLRTYAINGAHLSNTPRDLFMTPKIRTLWANLHIHGMWTRHNTQKEADDYDRCSGGTRIGNKAYKIEVE